MRLDPRTSLAARIGLLAVANLVALAIITVAGIGIRPPRSVQDLVLQLGGERLRDLSRRVALDLDESVPEDRDRMLAGYEAAYGSGMRLIVITNDGRPIAGAPLPLPAAVMAAVRARPVDPRGDADRRPPFPPPLRAPGPGSVRLPETPPFLVSVPTDPPYWLGVRIPVLTAEGRLPGTLLVTLDTLVSPLLFPVRAVALALIALVVTALSWWPFLRGVTASIRRMERATERIAEGRFETALGVDRRDELGRLARSIERMAGRLDGLVAGQKRFLSDTAHELRSPLARIRVALELLSRQAGDDAKGYVEDLDEDVQEMTQLTDDLLALARAERGIQEVVLTDVPVADGVARAVAQERRPPVEFDVDVPSGVRVRADADLFVRAVANLLRNAVRYAGGAGPVRIAVEVSGNEVDVIVADRGPGVPEEALDRLATPFYRVEPSRDRRSGGAGLGLSIVQQAVERCGGRLRCRNLVPHGLEVRLTWQRAI